MLSCNWVLVAGDKELSVSRNAVCSGRVRVGGRAGWHTGCLGPYTGGREATLRIPGRPAKEVLVLCMP